jgi:hypothetical protein
MAIWDNTPGAAAPALWTGDEIECDVPPVLAHALRVLDYHTTGAPAIARIQSYAPAAGGTTTGIATETISALTAVADSGAGYSVARDGWVSGISLSSSLARAPLQVQHDGQVSDVSWNWTVGSPVFATQEGQLTQTVPVSGLLTIVGVAISPTQLSIRIAVPVRLA